MTDPASGHPRHAQTEAGSVSSENGQVMLDGPDGVAVTMTPGAALETGRRLIAAARAAQDSLHQPG